jgi:peptide subunit release factor 1 (eRF1)
MIQREISTASNIKDKNTKDKVIKALSRVVKLFQGKLDTSKGLFIFSAYDGI